MECFAFEMGSDPWVNDNHRPVANAGKIFANMGQILVSLWDVKSELAWGFTLTFHTKLICSLPEGFSIYGIPPATGNVLGV